MNKKVGDFDKRMSDSNLRPLKLKIKMETNVTGDNFQALCNSPGEKLDPLGQIREKISTISILTIYRMNLKIQLIWGCSSKTKFEI